MSARAWSGFAAMSVLWGIPYLFIKVAVDGGMSPAFVAWVRVVLAALILLPLAHRAGTLRSLRGSWRWLALYAVFEISIPFPLIGLAGVVALMGIDVAGKPDEMLGAAAIVVAALGYAAGPMVLKRKVSTLDPRASRARGSRPTGGCHQASSRSPRGADGCRR